MVLTDDNTNKIRPHYAPPPINGGVASFNCGVSTNTGSAGVSTNTGSGIKHDQDKPDMSLLSGYALTEVAKVMTFGKKKYSAHNWRGGFLWSRPLSACLRHVWAFIGGEDLDPETGLSHIAHAICCLLFVLEFTKTKPELDDRFKG